jgi:hypothetical protein
MSTVAFYDPDMLLMAIRFAVVARVMLMYRAVVDIQKN